MVSVFYRTHHQCFYKFVSHCSTAYGELDLLLLTGHRFSETCLSVAVLLGVKLDMKVHTRIRDLYPRYLNQMYFGQANLVLVQTTAYLTENNRLLEAPRSLFCHDLNILRRRSVPTDIPALLMYHFLFVAQTVLSVGFYLWN